MNYPQFRRDESHIENHTKYYHYEQSDESHVNDSCALGQAQFGPVLTGYFCRDGVIQRVAVKTYSMAKIIANNSERRTTNEDPISELALLHNISTLVEHNGNIPVGIVRRICVYRTPLPDPHLHLVMPYVANADLFDILSNCHTVHPNAARIFHQLVDIISFLHVLIYHQQKYTTSNIKNSKI